MTRHLLAGAIIVSCLAVGVAGQQGPPVSAADVAGAIDKLGSFNLPVRTEASRTVRRASAAVAVPALTKAALQHTDGYVRYRALVLLAGFGDTSAAATMKQVMTDRNDRLRTVAYEWFEHHRDTTVLPSLIDALGRETSEFVRPALLRALGAYGDDPRARDAIRPLIIRGEDDFRGVVIEALGDYKTTSAVSAIAEVAKLDGPLQDDAVSALGRIGDSSVRPLLTELQRTAPRESQPDIASALVLLGVNATGNLDYLKKTLLFATTTDGYEPLLRGAAHGLAVLAVRNNREALDAMLDAGIPSKEPARATIALALGTVALRNSSVIIDGFEGRKDRDAAIGLLLEAFDRLASEDYELERFYVDVRHAYWDAPATSARRQMIETMIRKLEF